MNNVEKEQPIRIVKKVSGHGGGHGGAWKVAYADFVTAMMALFIVLWITGQSKDVKSYVSEYFRDPGAFNEKTKTGAMLGGKGMAADEISNMKRSANEKAMLEKMGEKIKKDLSAQQQALKLKNQITMEMVKDGLRIELVESSDAFFFDVGTAKLKPEAEQILKIIAAEVGKMPNHIIVEGHTDSRPYSSDATYTNYELSADRANSARRVLSKNGIDQFKMDQVRGFADKILRNKKDPYDVTNRRISIIVKFEGLQNE